MKKSLGIPLLIATASYAARGEDPRVVLSNPSIEEAFSKLEIVLGKYKPKDSRQYRKSLDEEVRREGSDSQPGLLVKSQGADTFGTPFRFGKAIAFDVVETLRRTNTALQDDREGKVVRRQQRFSVARYSLRTNENKTWSFDKVFVSHSTPGFAGFPYLTGTVEWLENGIVLRGNGVDDRFNETGGVDRVAIVGEITMQHAKDKLVIEDTWQSYELAVDGTGRKTGFPDLAKPLGEPASWMAGTATRE